MIINTGMRTDIPAFYSKWLMNRIKGKQYFTQHIIWKKQKIYVIEL